MADTLADKDAGTVMWTQVRRRSWRCSSYIWGMSSGHDRNHSDHHRRSWLNRLLDGARHMFAHDHDHGPSANLLDTGAVGIRATKISLAILGVTALAQGIIVAFSGSVALLSDTLHNVTDALTAIPL